MPGPAIRHAGQDSARTSEAAPGYRRHRLPAQAVGQTAHLDRPPRHLTDPVPRWLRNPARTPAQEPTTTPAPSFLRSPRHRLRWLGPQAGQGARWVRAEDSDSAAARLRSQGPGEVAGRRQARPGAAARYPASLADVQAQ